MNLEDTWWDLDFWGSEDWVTIQERLDEYDRLGIGYNPHRQQLFAALDSCSFVETKVAIVGQDPYPNRDHCTGIAFSIPNGCKSWPPTLQTILKEYCDDLGHPKPATGSLRLWCYEGVLLINAYHTCAQGRPGSHHWPEWESLTGEILQRLDERDRSCLFVFLGAHASKFANLIQENDYITLPHPSPLSAHRGFLGSRIFSTINSKLSAYHQRVNWSLKDEQDEEGEET